MSVNDIRNTTKDAVSVRNELLDALYATPKPIFIGAAMVTIVIAGAAVLGGNDGFLYGLAFAMAAVGLLRYYSHTAYERFRHSARSASGARHFERLAMLGAWLTAAVVTTFGTYSLIRYYNHPISLLGIAQTIGYLAGLSGRNTSRPLVTKVQVSIAAAPFSLALLWTGEPVHVLIGLTVILTMLLTFSSARILYEVFVSRHMTMRTLERVANLDTLTNLLNRRGLLRSLDEIAATKASYSLLSIDVDNFKTINDTFGHDIGDDLLVALGESFENLLKPGDVAARMSGDEFMIATRRPPGEAVELAMRIIAHVQSQRYVTNRNLTTTVSVGIAHAEGGNSVEDVLKRVDLALYRAKADGRNRYVAYSPELSAEHDDRLAFEAEMREGIRRGEFFLVYQPIYNPRSGTATHVEALLRWKHPTRGMVSPGIFIPIAEQTGLIKVLGAWAIETAARLAMDLPGNVRVSVNVSPHQFELDHDLVGIVDAVLRRTGLAPHRLILEITESALINEGTAVANSLRRLRDMGVGVALDDFGTGYSSLSYLTWLPIDILKIDKSFCREIETSQRAHALMGAITQLAHDLDLLIIVEGIETEAQLAAVRKFSIHGIQGYVFAKPMPEADLRNTIGDRVPGMRPGATGKDDDSGNAAPKNSNVA